MTPKQFYQKHSKKHVIEVAEAADTKYSNFQQIALANGSVGKDLAARLAKASSGEMSVLEILYPENFKDETSGSAF